MGLAYVTALSSVFICSSPNDLCVLDGNDLIPIGMTQKSCFLSVCHFDLHLQLVSFITSVKVVDNKAVDGLDTRLVKVANGNHHDQESELGSRVEADLGSSAQQEWAQVQCSARAVGGHKLEVTSDSTFTCLDKHVFGDGGHAGQIGRVLHAACVCVWAEDADLAILAPERLDSLEAL